MYITIDKTKYPCAGRPTANADTVRFVGVAGLPDEISGEIHLYSNDGDFALASYDTGDWERIVIDGESLTLTNLPEPEPPGPPPEPGPDPLEEVKADVADLGAAFDALLEVL